MTKLHQILAIDKGVKTRAYDQVTETDRIFTKVALLSGLSRVYRPKSDSDTEKLPGESTLVQVRVHDELRVAAAHLARSWDVTATKEAANTKAIADVRLSDATLLIKDAPVTLLLFLEKELIRIHTLVARLPTLDPQYVWTWDSQTNSFRSEDQQTHRTKKIDEPLVLYPATPEHPAQTQLVTRDEIVGFWHATHFSGAIPAQERQEMIDRVEELQRAVKMAREVANETDVVDMPIADTLLGYIFPKLSLRGGMSTDSATASV